MHKSDFANHNAGPARRPPRLFFSHHWMLAWRVVRWGGELQPPGQRRHLVPVRHLVLGLGLVPGVPIVATAPARASAQEGVNAERRGRARVVALRVTSARGNGWTAPDPYIRVFATGVTARVGKMLVFSKNASRSRSRSRSRRHFTSARTSRVNLKSTLALSAI